MCISWAWQCKLWPWFMSMLSGLWPCKCQSHDVAGHLWLHDLDICVVAISATFGPKSFVQTKAFLSLANVHAQGAGSNGVWAQVSHGQAPAQARCYRGIEDYDTWTWMCTWACVWQLANTWECIHVGPGQPGSLQEITFAFHYVPWFFSSSLCLSLFHFSAPSWQDIDFRMLWCSVPWSWQIPYWRNISKPMSSRRVWLCLQLHKGACWMMRWSFFDVGRGFEKTTRQRPAALCDALSCAVPKTANMPAQLWQERH